MRRLLLLACSRQKRPDDRLLPAIERYDGPAFRVLRHYLRGNEEESLDVHVLSAQFGLIRGGYAIPLYDHLMTRKRALELQGRIASEFTTLCAGQIYEDSFLCAGAIYREALIGIPLPAKSMIVAVGSMGAQLTQLKRWLHQDSEPNRVLNPTPIDKYQPVQFRLRGNNYAVVPKEAISVACTGAQNRIAAACPSSDWFVLVHGHKVAPKWLVSQLTNLPVRAFHSDEARRVLRQLGLTVRQA